MNGPQVSSKERLGWDTLATAFCEVQTWCIKGREDLGVTRNYACAVEYVKWMEKKTRDSQLSA